jgi:hypothetical protein
VSPSSNIPVPNSAYVAKLQVPVRLSQPQLAPRDGHFLLFPQHGNESRPESLLELLNSGRTVIPFILAGDHTVLLLTRLNVDWVAVGSNVDPALVFPPGLEHNRSERVELRFIDESRVDAHVEWYVGAGGNRLSDFLNTCDAFVASRTGFGTLIWNKHRIRETRILGAAGAIGGMTPDWRRSA